jgi:hypothetical protein
VSSISAVFTPSADGSIHLPIPPELRGNARLRVVAWLEPDIQGAKSPSPGQWAQRARGIARRLPGESLDDARFAALSQKLGEH